MYEKSLGLFWVPFLFIILVLQSVGILRRQINNLVQYLLKVKFVLNGVTIYVFPLIAIINVLVMAELYRDLMSMHEPPEGDKAGDY